ESDGHLHMLSLVPKGASEEEFRKVEYHFWMLIGEAALVRGVPAHSHAHNNWVELNLTWKGHEFVESVRDPEVWRRTKEGTSKIGNAGVEFMWELAKAYGKHVVKERLGIDLS